MSPAGFIKTIERHHSRHRRAKYFRANLRKWRVPHVARVVSRVLLGGQRPERLRLKCVWPSGRAAGRDWPHPYSSAVPVGARPHARIALRRCSARVQCCTGGVCMQPVIGSQGSTPRWPRVPPAPLVRAGASNGRSAPCGLANFPHHPNDPRADLLQGVCGAIAFVVIALGNPSRLPIINGPQGALFALSHIIGSRNQFLGLGRALGLLDGQLGHQGPRPWQRSGR